MTRENEIEVLRLPDFYPGHGESYIEINWAEGVAKLSIYYDSKSEPHTVNSIVITFNSCVACELASFPGITMYEYKGSSVSLGSLIQYKTSEYADRWNEHFGYKNNEIKHFSVLFLNDNNQFNVFAKSHDHIVQ